ncbi:hypothetical protein WICPIJ_002667 [Wickerhamomyces pijperi]|uniref:Uncharacterized protein n=1 Tax=Wickerhamomyces pijperi TaxID=599730 RepID=A0A9P8QB73_WICPI|nr:hypothetical protein WICPIJ_002667 [Wickerhamomyces pijperi]
MTDSFSIGFMEQVEYTSLPPSSNKSIPLCKILNCNGFNPKPSPRDHLFQIWAFFLMVPSPEHGTSHRILSNLTNSSCNLTLGKNWASWLTTIMFGEFNLLI